MANDFTADDIRLLGYAEPTEVFDDPGFRVLDATIAQGLENIGRRFLYLKARCGPRDADRAAGFVTTNTSVIRAPRSTEHDRFRQRLGTPRIHVQEDLVWDVLSGSFSEYLRQLASGLPREEYFIAPRSSDRAIGEGLVDRLLRYLRATGSDDTDDGVLQVLASNAGVGKTTLSRHLIQRLLEGGAKVIPVYVESEHWRRLNLSSIEDLWDVIENSLRMFSPPLALNQQLFRHALRQGYICFIFDGFDELCGFGGAPFDPTAVLYDLCSVAASSEARVLLTTRSRFWEARISGVPDNVRIWSLDAFNRQQAGAYFRRVFARDREKANLAAEVYAQLRRAAQPPEHTGSVRDQFVNLPLCVRMVADYVRDGGTSVTASSIERPVLQNFLTDICQRETRRQSLQTPALRQLASLQDVALSYSGVNPSFPLADLLLLPDGVYEEDLDKMADHALLRPASVGDRQFGFRYDFIGPFFRASAIAESLRVRPFSALPETVKSVITDEADGKGNVLEQLRYFIGARDLPIVADHARQARLADPDVAPFFFHLAVSIVSDHDALLTRKERATRLFSALCGESEDTWSPTVSGWRFRGPLSRLKLKGIRFLACKFLDCSFKHCEVDDTTVLEGCVFGGYHAIEGGTGWHRLTVKDDCRFLYPADTVWESVLGRGVGDRRERATKLLDMVLSKFWRQGRINASIALTNWNTGRLGQSGQAALVLDVILAADFAARIKITGVGDGGVAVQKDAMADLQNYMDNNRVVGKVEAVHTRLLTALA